MNDKEYSYILHDSSSFQGNPDTPAWWYYPPQQYNPFQSHHISIVARYRQQTVFPCDRRKSYHMVRSTLCSFQIVRLWQDGYRSGERDLHTPGFCGQSLRNIHWFRLYVLLLLLLTRFNWHIPKPNTHNIRQPQVLFWLDVCSFILW